MSTTPQDVLEFWFGAPRPHTFDGVMGMVKRWSPRLDDECRERFGDIVEAAFGGAFEEWTATPQGVVALVLVLDQFPRHIFRGTARQYEGDARALELARRAVESGLVDELEYFDAVVLQFPLAHSEAEDIQRLSVDLNDRLGLRAPDYVGFVAEIGPSQSRKYLDVIERFGRFPHRNEMLGRESTPEELEFLETWAERQGPDALRDRGMI